MKKTILSKISSKKSTIGIIGLGYVGLPLVMRFAEEGYKVIGFDINKDKIDSLNNGKSYIKHILQDQLIMASKSGFLATSDFKKISLVDVIIICVPTPLGSHHEPDLSYIKDTLKIISPYFSKGQVLILESTTYPGTTEEEILPVIENLNFKIGTDFFVGYSPEREDPGNKNFTTKTIPKIVSGHTKSCLSIVSALYSNIIDEVVSVSSIKVAEMTKILENIHRAVNIGLVNELKIVADKMDIDIFDVINAASTKPFGFTAYYPGPGLGGHCIPIDPFYLTWKAKELGMSTRFIELAGEINESMPIYVIQKIVETLNNVNKSIKGSKILVLGLSYKKNVDDLRESPSLKIIHKLTSMGAKISFSDPFFDNIPVTRKYNFDLKSSPLTKTILNSSDIVLLSTDHDIFDYDLIFKEAKLIVDTRGRYNNSNPKIVRA